MPKITTFAEIVVRSKIRNRLFKRLRKAISGFNEMEKIKAEVNSIRLQINKISPIRFVDENNVIHYSRGFYLEEFDSKFRDITDTLEYETPRTEKRMLGLLKKYFESHDENDYQEFKTEFYELVKQKHSQETLLIKIAQDVCTMTMAPIGRNAQMNFDLKTSIYAGYTNPPMGMSEFITKSVEKDILDAKQIGDNK